MPVEGIKSPVLTPWDLVAGQCTSTLVGHSDRVSAVAWSYNAARLASGSRDKTVKIWDPATGQCETTLEGHSDRVWSVAWSHDATRLASASGDGTVKIWKPATGQFVSLNVGNVFYHLQFHQCNSDLLHTELGTFDLRTAAMSAVFGFSYTDRLSPTAVGYGLSSDGTWIKYEGKNLLRLPPDYRPSSSAISETAMTIGCSSGRILIFKFPNSNLIP